MILKGWECPGEQAGMEKETLRELRPELDPLPRASDPQQVVTWEGLSKGRAKEFLLNVSLFPRVPGPRLPLEVPAVACLQLLLLSLCRWAEC